MVVLSEKRALEVLKEFYSIKDAIIQGELWLSSLQDKDFDIHIELSFINCIFQDNVVSWSVYHRERVAFQNCIFNGDVTLSTFTFKDILIEECQFCGYADFSGCGFYQGFILKENTFEKFVNFEDSDLRGQGSFINNQFKGGTNLMHPKGGPSGAHFGVPPYLEGNTGLDQYERPE